jgi:hypothetical protein
MTTVPIPAAEKRCPRGCSGTDPDDCRASLMVRCPLGFWEAERNDESGRFQPCGCLERSRCSGCGHCANCVGCFCGEE